MRAVLAFLAARLIRALIAVWLVSTVVFVVMRLSGDPVPLMLPPDAPTSEIFRVRAELGLDQPLPIQYFVFLGNVVRGDTYLHNVEEALVLAQHRLVAAIGLQNIIIVETPDDDARSIGGRLRSPKRGRPWPA